MTEITIRRIMLRAVQEEMSLIAISTRPNQTIRVNRQPKERKNVRSMNSTRRRREGGRS